MCPLEDPPSPRPSEPVGRSQGAGVGWATFAGAIGPPQHSALIDGPEGLEHLPDVLICLLLP